MVLVVDRTLGPLESPDRMIVVEPDDEHVAQFCASLQQRDMPGVEDIEAAVGEDDLLPALAGGPDLDQHLVERAGATQLAGPLAEQVVVDLLDGDRGDAEDLDLEPGGGVGKAGRVDPVEPVGPRGGQCREHHIARAGHIVHLACGGGDMDRLRVIAVCEQSALFVEGEHDGVEVE